MLISRRFVLCCVAFWATIGGSARAASLTSGFAELEAALPRSAADYGQVRLDTLRRAAQTVEQGAVDLTLHSEQRPAAMAVAATEQFLATKYRLDQRLDQTLASASQVAVAAQAETSPERQRLVLHNYMLVANQLIDLSGRLRYLTFDVLRNAVGDVDESPSERQRLLDLLGALSFVGRRDDVFGCADRIADTRRSTPRPLRRGLPRQPRSRPLPSSRNRAVGCSI